MRAGRDVEVEQVEPFDGLDDLEGKKKHIRKYLLFFLLLCPILLDFIWSRFVLD